MKTREPVVEVMDDMVAEIMRQKTPIERLEIAMGLWETARVLIWGAVETEHSEWSEEQVKKEVARRISNGATDDVPW